MQSRRCRLERVKIIWIWSFFDPCLLSLCARFFIHVLFLVYLIKLHHQRFFFNHPNNLVLSHVPNLCLNGSMLHTWTDAYSESSFDEPDVTSASDFSSKHLALSIQTLSFCALCYIKIIIVSKWKIWIIAIFANTWLYDESGRCKIALSRNPTNWSNSPFVIWFINFVLGIFF